MTKNLIKQMMVKPAEGEDSFDAAGFVETINKGYTANLETRFQVKKKFIPSKLAYGEGKCPRYWYLAFEGANFEDNSTAFSIANMKNGVKSHERILGMALKNSGIAVDIEFEISHNGKDGTLLLGGFCDGMVNWKNDDYVLELKTSNNEAFEYRKNVGQPKTGHVEQLLLYMKVLKKAKGVILYENKNTHELLAFPIEANETYKQWINTTFDWMEVVKDAWKEKNLPMKPYRSNSKICKGCALKTDCFKAEAGTIKIEPLEELSETM
jgi:CRISPR/Cas system-associated exonuclease Cas4 (RecB family)